VLTGQAGNDTLIGISLDAPPPPVGEQYVDFVFGRNDGQDTIVNFTGVKGIKDDEQFRDEVRLDHFFDVSDFADLYKLMSQHGSDAWINFGHGDMLIFKDFNYHAFRPEDFIFVVN